MVGSLLLYRRDGLSHVLLRWAACVRPSLWPHPSRRASCGSAPQDEELAPHGEERRSRISNHEARLSSVMVLKALGQLLDILGRPARHFHAEVQTHLGQHF